MNAGGRGFASYHPLSLMAFFAAAIVLCIVVQDLLFQLAGLGAALCLYLSIKRARGIKLVGGLLIAGALIAALNPLFSTTGSVVLFEIVGHPYTLESLAYGVSTALMFVTMILWFASLSRLLDAERLSYLLGGFAPSLTLVLSMLMRLIPSFRRKAENIADARACIGKSVAGGPLGQRVQEGASTLSTLTRWTLEDSVVMADSMRSRGYGLAKRSSYARYSFGVRDVALLSWLVALLACVIAGCAAGMISSDPLAFGTTLGFGFLGWLTLVAFTMFLMTPFVLNVIEELSWHLSVSRI